MKSVLLAAVLVCLFSMPSIYAGCALDAYLEGCNACDFDNQTGKFDRSCTDAKTGVGTACLAAKYPVAMASYRAGKCPGVDRCTAQLNNCISRQSSGNEALDCAKGDLNFCYSTLDVCLAAAASECSDVPSPCPAPAGIIIIGGGAALLAAFMGRRGGNLALAATPS